MSVLYVKDDTCTRHGIYSFSYLSAKGGWNTFLILLESEVCHHFFFSYWEWQWDTIGMEPVSLGIGIGSHVFPTVEARCTHLFCINRQKCSCCIFWWALSSRQACKTLHRWRSTGKPSGGITTLWISINIGCELEVKWLIPVESEQLWYMPSSRTLNGLRALKAKSPE